MRAMWKGAVSFGLVSVPVKLYAATTSRRAASRSSSWWSASWRSSNVGVAGLAGRQ